MVEYRKGYLIKKHMLKGFSTVLFIIIIIVIVIIAILVWPKGEQEVVSPTGEQEEEEETMDVQVYFVDKQMMIQGTADYKDMVKPVIRTIPKTEVVARAAIEELLKGLVDNEDDTYSNSIPNGTKMNSLNIENRGAYVDFSEELGNYGGGSATVSTIEWQINKTLMQFSTVDNVIISIEGETDNILQP